MKKAIRPNTRVGIRHAYVYRHAGISYYNIQHNDDYDNDDDNDDDDDDDVDGDGDVDDDNSFTHCEHLYSAS